MSDALTDSLHAFVQDIGREAAGSHSPVRPQESGGGGGPSAAAGRQSERGVHRPKGKGAGAMSPDAYHRLYGDDHRMLGSGVVHVRPERPGPSTPRTPSSFGSADQADRAGCVSPLAAVEACGHANHLLEASHSTKYVPRQIVTGRAGGPASGPATPPVVPRHLAPSASTWDEDSFAPTPPRVYQPHLQPSESCLIHDPSAPFGQGRPTVTHPMRAAAPASKPGWRM